MSIFSMGAYTLYVWSSVGLVILALVMSAWRAHAQFSRSRQAIAWSQHALKS